MKIAIVGSGSIGLYYGARLAASGHDVHFLLRRGYDEARAHGIRITSPAGDLHLPRPTAHRDPAAIGPCDLVLIGLKTTQNAILPALLPPLLGPDTALLTLQNGLGSEEFLSAHFGADRILGGLCFVCLTRTTPAQVVHVGHGTISLGEFSRPPQPRTETIAQAFRTAGIETHVEPDLATARWKKLVWNIPFNGLAVAENSPVDVLLRSHEPAIRALMRETLATAAALDHAIPPGYDDWQIERTRSMGAYKPSTLVDYRAGTELEIDAIWAAPLRAARAAGVATPHLAALLARLKALPPPTKE